ncbi:MAG: ORF6N domain-containing protein [Candidatus Omnitrophica bacterium]|nr:ORF6N domain-containing protein [Candidatus Omnitrophota bacterium]MDD5546569.1 ORF6N domain-containing protein [Candidatus Omnitrophota bacterium]
MSEIVARELIEQKIFWIRGRKVMLDKDLAELYGVPTKRLKEQVNRNMARFPEDFLFQLTWQEAEISRSQIATLKQGRNIKYLPYAFTEQGVAMLSSVLNSERAIEVNITIMRTFVKMRRLLETHKGLLRKIEEMEKKYDYQFKVVFEIIKNFIKEEEKPKRKIGFRIG